MGILTKWRDYKARRSARAANLALNDDEASKAIWAPEVAGMDFVQGGAYILKEIDSFKRLYGQEAAEEFAYRFKASVETWERQGLTSPYWNALVVLRNLQAEIDPEHPLARPIPNDSLSS